MSNIIIKCVGVVESADLRLNGIDWLKFMSLVLVLWQILFHNFTSSCIIEKEFNYFNRFFIRYLSYHHFANLRTFPSETQFIYHVSRATQSLSRDTCLRIFHMKEIKFFFLFVILSTCDNSWNSSLDSREMPFLWIFIMR